MTREQQLEAALRDIIINPTPEALAVGYDLLNICRACDRDIDREGRCSLCQDGEKEMWAESGYRNTRIDD